MSTLRNYVGCILLREILERVREEEILRIRRESWCCFRKSWSCFF